MMRAIFEDNSPLQREGGGEYTEIATETHMKKCWILDVLETKEIASTIEEISNSIYSALDQFCTVQSIKEKENDIKM
jgi:hypothetical protein